MLSLSSTALAQADAPRSDALVENGSQTTAAPEPESLTAIDEATLLPLLMDFARSEHPEAQKNALVQASLLKHPFLLPHIRYLARLGEPEVRMIACETLAAYQNVAGLQELKLAIDDEHSPLAIRAIELLAKFPLPSIRATLVEVIHRSDERMDLREAAVLSLRNMGTPEARKDLGELSSTISSELRELAALPFPSTLTPEPQKTLVMRRLFTADYLKGRLEAIASLTATFTSTEAKDILRTCLREPEKNIQIAALNEAANLNQGDAEVILREGLRVAQPSLVLPWLKLSKALDAERVIPILIQATSQNYPRGLREGSLLRLSEVGPYQEDASATQSLVELFELSSNDPLRYAIAQALSARPAPNAFLPLYKTLGNKGAEETIRKLALSTLIQRQPIGLQDDLIKFARTEPSPAVRRQAAMELMLNHCDELGDTCREFNYHDPSEAANALYLASAGLMGATSLGLLSSAAGGNQPYIAALSGAVLSSGSAYLLAPKDGITMPEAFHFTSLGLWGTALGYGIGATAIDGLDKPSFAWTLLGGQVLGSVLGASTFNDTPVTSSELALMHWSGVEAASAALGGMLIWGKENPTDYQRQMGPALSTLAGLGLGVVPMWFLADDLKFSETDTALIILSTLGGGALGSLAASGTSHSNSAGAGGFLLGQGLGYLTSMVASQHVDLTPGELAWVSLSTGIGTAMGAGVHILADRDQHQSIGLAGFIGGITLTTASSLTAQYFDLTIEDGDMALVSALLGASLGVTIPLMAGDSEFEHAGGGLVLGASTGLLGGLIYDHLSEVSLADSSLTLAATAAGGFLGGGLALLLPNTQEQLAGALLTTFTLTGYGAMTWAAPKLEFVGGDTLLTFGAMAIGGFIGGTIPGLAYG
ncbi:MAG: HEAT repeat domain-containing protein, partial [Deltaproteobacteria bacterium]|nr:HEAT repeat domain-containing protein [Deltaproteobacteria bacterium]